MASSATKPAVSADGAVTKQEGADAPAEPVSTVFRDFDSMRKVRPLVTEDRKIPIGSCTIKAFHYHLRRVLNGVT